MSLITEKALLNTEPGKTHIWLYDKAPKGHGRFCARITPTGNRLFYFRYTTSTGKRAYIPLGGYDKKGIKGLTLKAARAKAGELSQLYQSGVTDLREYLDVQRAAEEARLEAEKVEAEKAAQRLTVKGLFEKWKASQLVRRKDKGEEIERAFKKDVLDAIGDKYADEVSKGDISKITDSILARGANRLARVVFADLRQMFRWAVYRDWLDADPTAKIRKADIGRRDTERDRVLSNDEIGQIAQKMSEAGLLPTSEAAVWICLATCCRIGELLNARWEHVDFDRKIWTIPADNAKNGQALEVSLSDFSLRQFEVVWQHRSNYEWLYPNRDKKGPVCSKTITKQLTDRQRTEAMRNRSQNSGTLVLAGGRWTPHDLRRTGATLMATLGVAPEVIERCLNHVEQNKVRRIYQRYSYASEMREAWVLLGERLEFLVGGREPSKVVPIRAVKG